MPSIEQHDGDAAGFIKQAQDILSGLERRYTPAQILLVRIDNWFGSRWCGFAGKALGAVGVHDPSDLRVPPFHPNRVVSESAYVREDHAYSPVDAPPLHVDQTSSSNLVRRLADLAPDSAVLWISGNSEPNGRGALMAYAQEGEDHRGWYLGLEGSDDWSVQEALGIDRSELALLLAAQ